ncbi:MAG TPA: hypothetical protein VMN36_01395 [Verrucomicrobiales bacterium]|nr:hypothetical protein [Verrucomicrobiales bacterium]
MTANQISRRKPPFPVDSGLRRYLERYGRLSEVPVDYEDLLDFREYYPVEDSPAARGGSWLTLVYDSERLRVVNRALCLAYSAMKTDGDISVMEHLSVARVDFCEFGNSQPFRIRIVNHFNDNHDHFYVKRADASRIFGLELEHILSPNRMGYMVRGDTLVEEHIAGVPGDQFMRQHLGRAGLNRVRIAKEFVKFNERCFVRLLGDMRSQNYVVDITPDFEDEQYRIRAIDFDQQSYEGPCNHYFPYLWTNNSPIVDMVRELLNNATLRQYRHEERTLMARRLRASRSRYDHLNRCMRDADISTAEKIRQLADELAEHHRTLRFGACRTMGELLDRHLEVCLARAVRQLYQMQA